MGNKKLRVRVPAARASQEGKQWTGPKQAVRMAAALKQATGVDATVGLLRPGRWQLVLVNARIRLTIDYAARRPGGPILQVASELYEDGKPRAIARGFDDFVQIFNSASGPVAAVQLDSMPPAADVAEAPSTVRAAYGSLQARLGESIDVSVGFDGGRWAIGLDVGEATGLRLWFTCHDGEWGVRPGDMQVVSGGVDVSDRAGGDVSEALALLTQPLVAGEPGKGPITGAWAPQAKKPTGVMVRNTTVIRN